MAGQPTCVPPCARVCAKVSWRGQAGNQRNGGQLGGGAKMQRRERGRQLTGKTELTRNGMSDFTSPHNPVQCSASVEAVRFREEVVAPGLRLGAQRAD